MGGLLEMGLDTFYGTRFISHTLKDTLSQYLPEHLMLLANSIRASGAVDAKNQREPPFSSETNLVFLQF